jgi:hypothetical protein
MYLLDDYKLFNFFLLYYNFSSYPLSVSNPSSYKDMIINVNCLNKLLTQ